MMNMNVITREQPSKRDIQAFVKDLGGQWLSSQQDYGIIERGNVFVIIDYGRVNDVPSDYESAEIEFLTRELGVRPQTEIGLAVRKNVESEAFALEIVKLIQRRWGGFFDHCERRKKPLGT